VIKAKNIEDINSRIDKVHKIEKYQNSKGYKSRIKDSNIGCK